MSGSVVKLTKPTQHIKSHKAVIAALSRPIGKTIAEPKPITGLKLPSVRQIYEVEGAAANSPVLAHLLMSLSFLPKDQVRMRLLLSLDFRTLCDVRIKSAAGSGRPLLGVFVPESRVPQFQNFGFTVITDPGLGHKFLAILSAGDLATIQVFTLGNSP